MNADKNDVILIELDRPRELRFSNKALKEYSALTNTTMRDIEESLFAPANQMAAACVLLKHDAIRNGEKPMTLEQVEDLLDEHNIKPGKLFWLLNKAMAAAFSDEEMEAEAAARQAEQVDPPTVAGTGQSN